MPSLSSELLPDGRPRARPTPLFPNFDGLRREGVRGRKTDLAVGMAGGRFWGPSGGGGGRARSGWESSMAMVELHREGGEGSHRGCPSVSRSSAAVARSPASAGEGSSEGEGEE